MLSGTDLLLNGLDLLLEAIDSCLGVEHMGEAAWLWLILALCCTDTLINGCMLSLKSVCVLVFLFVTAGGPNLTWFKPFSLGL